MEDKITKEWIRQCLFEYVADYLEGVGDYLLNQWKIARKLEDGVPSYKKWLENLRLSDGFNKYVGMYWYDRCGTEEKFKEFMTSIDLGGYIDKFKEDFEVNIVKVEFGKGLKYFHRFWFDIEVIML